jgi:GNAT superfamily N-acetyltransferase
MPDLEPRQALAADAAGVARTLALAFAGDPLWGDWAFLDVADRVSPLTEFWGPFVAAALKNGGAWMTPAFEAVALWVPPGLPEMDEDDEAAATATIERVCGPRAPMVLEAFERFDAARPDAEHWYLSLLATHPDHRGRGIGMELVRDRLRAIDADGLAAYLESTNPVNLARYTAAGFKLLGSFEVPDGPRVDTMWREPRSPTQSRAG